MMGSGCKQSIHEQQKQQKTARACVTVPHRCDSRGPDQMTLGDLVPQGETVVESDDGREAGE